jgi:energy-converting hydrogenase Eha subunit G
MIMSTSGIDGKAIVNTAYHAAIVAGLTIGIAKLTKMAFKAKLPSLDADVYDVGMLTLDIAGALALRDLLIKHGLPVDIMK